MSNDPDQKPDGSPIFGKRQLTQSALQFAAVFLSTFAAHAANLKDVTLDAVYVSAMAAALSVVGVFAVSKLPPK